MKCSVPTVRTPDRHAQSALDSEAAAKCSHAFAFYLEPDDGTVLAIDSSLYRDTRHGRVYEGLGAIYPEENSPVTWTSASAAYLRECIPICPGEARRRHPALFERLQ